MVHCTDHGMAVFAAMSHYPCLALTRAEPTFIFFPKGCSAWDTMAGVIEMKQQLLLEHLDGSVGA